MPDHVRHDGVWLFSRRVNSNVFRHAIDPDRPINLLLALTSTEGQHQLIVQDDGKGLPVDLDIGRINSIGLRIVKALTKQIRGSIDINPQNPTEFRISFAT